MKHVLKLVAALWAIATIAAAFALTGSAAPAGAKLRIANSALGRILVDGGIHVQQYYDAYFRSVPTIGTLFLLSFLGAGLVGAGLLAPVRLLGRRTGDLLLALAALGAIGIALGTLVSLVVSEYTPLFGFMESGYRPAVLLTLLFDGLTAAFLGLFFMILRPAFLHHDNGERTR